MGRRGTVSLVAIVLATVGLSAAPAIEARLQGTASVRPSDARSAPLALPPSVDTTGSHAFVQTVDDRPVRYDPCAPIHVVVNARTAVDGADEIVSEALASVGAATGLTFVEDGHTDESPSRDRGSAPGSNGPVLIAWSDPAEIEDLKGSVAGVGGSVSIRGSQWFDTGAVTLDGPQMKRVLREPMGRDLVRAVVLHELGHLVGLDHVDAEGELMQPQGELGVTDWGPGDREGLARLGGGGCRDY